MVVLVFGAAQSKKNSPHGFLRGLPCRPFQSPHRQTVSDCLKDDVDACGSVTFGDAVLVHVRDHFGDPLRPTRRQLSAALVRANSVGFRNCARCGSRGSLRTGLRHEARGEQHLQVIEVEADALGFHHEAATNVDLKSPPDPI